MEPTLTLPEDTQPIAAVAAPVTEEATRPHDAERHIKTAELALDDIVPDPENPWAGDAPSAQPENHEAVNGAVNGHLPSLNGHAGAANCQPAKDANGTHQPPPVSLSPDSGNLPAGPPGCRDGRGRFRTTSKRSAQRRGRRASKNVLIAKTYDQLATLVQAAAGWHIKLLILVGRPGCGKSQIVRAAFGPNDLYLHGRVTPMRMYIRLYEHRDQAFILDDLDSLIADPLGLGLLLDLCSTDGERTVSWQTTSDKLEKEGVPPSFTVKGPVVIITNNWGNVHQKLPALEDRGVLVFFDPSSLDVHTCVAEWFDDQEIHDFLGANLPFIPGLSMRHYVIARDFKRGALHWQNMLIDDSLEPALRMVAQLKNDPSYPQQEDRARAFVASGLGSRATYFRYAKKLKNLQPVPPMQLPHARKLS